MEVKIKVKMEAYLVLGLQAKHVVQRGAIILVASLRNLLVDPEQFVLDVPEELALALLALEFRSFLLQRRLQHEELLLEDHLALLDLLLSLWLAFLQCLRLRFQVLQLRFTHLHLGLKVLERICASSIVF